MGQRGKKRDKKPPERPAEKELQTSAVATTPAKTVSDDRSKPPMSGGKMGRGKMSRGKLWAFRLVTAVGVPLLLFVALELGLRIVGFGYPTGFFLRSEQAGKPVLIENNQFGWRFFGPRLARSPSSMSVPVEKPKDTVRLCVFGESAAFGDPQPDFGLPRMLQAMLSLRHPQLRFEVVNAAMTGINSHTVREIAKDCVATDSDLWIVYMGNNEVVGPFGAGTVFGKQTPPLSMIRANLAFKKTRVAQLLERIVPAVQGAPGGDAEWGGMEMFLNNQVGRDDARMQTVYHHFEKNLQDIVDIARRNKIGVVVSTVAVNLTDCAPFASAMRSSLAADKIGEWESLCREAIKNQQAGNDSDAIAAFEKAALIDDTIADLHFRWGQSLLNAGNVTAARQHLQLACDLDRLRFRCDSRMNEIIRDVAAGREKDGVRLVDSAEEFHERSSPKVSGKEYFYEHVHLTFEGNYLLARLLAEQAEALLPKEKLASANTAADWPTREQCADRLAWSPWALCNALTDVSSRLEAPPFSSQLNHTAQLQDIATQLAQLRGTIQPANLQKTAEQTRRAAEAAADDHVLYSQLALLLGQLGDADGAYQAALKASQLLPHNAGKMFQLGIVLGIQRRDEEAIAAFNKSLSLSANDPWARLELAKTLIRLNRKSEALTQMEHAIAINPRFGPAYLLIGMLREEQGKNDEAEKYYHQAVEHRVRRTADLAAIAQICQRKRWFEDAVTIYLEVLRLNPVDPAARLGAAQCLDALERHAEAEQHFVQLLELVPDSAQARYEFGVHFAKLENHTRAAEQFGAAANLKPDFIVARIDFAMALLASDRQREALAQFNEVLTRDPKNKTALEFKAAIEKELGMQ